jgi:hypothetical protein
MKITDKDTISVFLTSLLAVGVGIWINWFLEIKIDVQTIPTLVNGITACASIIFGFLIAFTGIVIRGFEKPEFRNWEFPLTVMILLLIPLFWLFGAYVDLAMGQSQNALRLAFISFIAVLFACYLVMMYSTRRISK